jgi:hypothetical protein
LAIRHEEQALGRHPPPRQASEEGHS